jgi:hydrogenase expression/formation protein HypC
MEYEPEAAVGDYVLVHVGFAISRIDRAQAEHAWEVLTATGQTAELEVPP